MKAYEYTHEMMAGFTPTANLFWSFYYGMTGLHALHVVGGMIAATVFSLMFVPSFFVVFQSLAEFRWRRKGPALATGDGSVPPAALMSAEEENPTDRIDEPDLSGESETDANDATDADQESESDTDKE